MISKAHRLLLLLPWMVFTFSAWTQEDRDTLNPQNQKPDQILSTSPDGAFQIRRRQADPGEHGEARKILSITSPTGKTLYEWNSPLGATTVLWRPDSRGVAVNDMPGDRGDQLLLFSLDPGTGTALPLRDQDGTKLLSEVEKRHGSFLSKVEKAVLRATDWKENRLWCSVTGTFSPKRQPTVHVPYHHLWVYRINGTNAPVLEQEWTMTDPKERAYRDSAGNP